MHDLRKYPRTQHIEGSGLQKDDADLERVPFFDIVGKPLVIEEKLDGANSGISFTDSGEMLLQCRGHYLTGGPGEAQFAILKTWASVHQSALWEVLGTRYIVYGEWMYAKHTVFYDALPHYFM
ncbi:MAG: DNA ligase, partial [Proteobacteria bacterium]